MSQLVLPGQPLPAAFNTTPLPQCGTGCYEHEGKILASVVGRPVRDGSVRRLPLTFPLPSPLPFSYRGWNIS
jgi:exosome complex RNA-binding protein Rrp4